MIIDFGVVILLIVCHWIADFILQDSEWAVNKHRDVKKLLLHTIIYSFFFLVSLLNYHWVTNDVMPFYRIGIFTLITFITHTIIDFISSRKLKRMYEKQQFGSTVPNWGFFTVMGLDQTLHFIQLMSTYYILF